MINPKDVRLVVLTLFRADLCGLDKNQRRNTEKCEFPRDKDSVNFLNANKSKLLEGPFCGRLKYNFPRGIALKAKREIFAGSLISFGSVNGLVMGVAMEYSIPARITGISLRVKVLEEF